MTKTHMISAALTSLLVLGAASAQAQGQGPRGEGRMPAFSVLDADGSGTISRAELAALGEARFKATDSNGDGKLTANEMKAAADGRRADGAARMIDRLDSNKDGALSYAEMSAGRGPAQMFERLDANSDGALSEEEFAQLKTLRGGRQDGQRGQHRNN
ncbi:EF-hand domain-containing protein [Roseivivax sp. CAU 1753]